MMAWCELWNIKPRKKKLGKFASLIEFDHPNHFLN
jgi:hypothetical protein